MRTDSSRWCAGGFRRRRAPRPDDLVRRRLLLSERGGRASIQLVERGIESSGTAKSGFYGDIRHGEVRFIQQAFGLVGAQRLRNLFGRGANVLLQQAAQMPSADSQPIGQFLNRPVIECPLRNEPHGAIRGGAGAIPGGAEWCCFRATSQARAKPSLLCSRSTWIERDVLFQGWLHPTDGTAVNASCPHTDKKHPIKRGIALAHRSQACREIKHARTLT